MQFVAGLGPVAVTGTQGFVVVMISNAKSRLLV